MRQKKLTSTRHPAAGAWNCCRSNPTRVCRYDDGSAGLVCQSCSGSIAMTRLHRVPVWTEGIRPNALYRAWLAYEDDSDPNEPVGMEYMFGVVRGIDAITMLGAAEAPELLRFEVI